MVLQGRADATLNANVSFFDYLSQHPDAAIKIVAESEEANEIAKPTRTHWDMLLERRSEDELKKLLDKRLEMHHSGWIPDYE